MNDELEYLGTTRGSSLKRSVNVDDERDLPILKHVQNYVKEQIEARLTIDRLTVDEKDFTVKQQLAINQAVVAVLRELDTGIEDVIQDIKEKYEQ